MSKYAVDVDDSQGQIVEMTQAEIGAFKKHISIASKAEDCKSKQRKKIKGSKQEKSDKTRKSSAKRGPKQSKYVKKPRKSSFSSQQSQQKPIKRRERKQTVAYCPQIPQQRFGKQIKQSEIVKYGNAKFVKNGTKSPVFYYSQKAKDTLKTGVTWWILNGDYCDDNWPRIFSDMYEFEVGDLRISNNNYPNMIRDLHHIRFDNLGILNLSDNNIYSIELLARMRAPLLRDLSIRSNKITSLRCMAKMSLKNLVNLSIADNHIMSMDSFYCVNTQSLEQIFIEWAGSPVVGRSMSWLAKLKKNPKSSKVKEYMKKVVVQSKDRIPQRAVDAMLANKYRQPDLIQRKAK